MLDDLIHFKPLDPGRINTMDALEMKYWCKQLHCTDKQLHDAIAKVGDHVTEVRKALAKHG
jgi:Protein of unknown function (DUF3606)